METLSDGLLTISVVVAERNIQGSAMSIRQNRWEWRRNGEGGGGDRGRGGNVIDNFKHYNVAVSSSDDNPA